MKLSWKIITSMFLVGAFTLTMLSTLMYYKYQSNIQNLTRDRFTITLLDIQNSVANNLKLGTQLFEISNIQNVISHSKKSDPDIISIEVFEIKKGKVNSLFNTDSQTKISENDKKTILNTKDLIWKINKKSTTLIGLNLKDIVKKDIGGIAICYSNEYTNEKQKIIFNNIFQRLSIMLVVMFTFICFLVFIFFGKTFNTLSYMKNLLSKEHMKKTSRIDQDISGEFEKTLLKIQKEIENIEKIEKSMKEKT